jgi:hypothetical protein
MSTVEVDLELEERPAWWQAWTLTTGSKALAGYSIILFGWTATETSGSAAATVNLYDGADTSGAIVLPINLAQSESASDWYNRGVWLRNGATVAMGSGQAKGSIFFRHYRL